MLSMIRWRWKLLPQRWGVFRVSLPYWVMSSRLKFPLDGSSQVAMRCPLGPSFRQERPALKPEKRANGSIEPNPAETTRAVAEPVVETVLRPRIDANNDLYDCCGIRTRTRVYDESNEMQFVSGVVTANTPLSV